MKTTLLILFVAAYTMFAQAQGPYRLTWKTDGFLLGTAALLEGAKGLANVKLKNLTLAEVKALNTSDINSFDRSAIYNHSDAAEKRSDYGAYIPATAAAISPLAIPLFKNTSDYWHEVGTLTIIVLEANIICAAGTDLVKSLGGRIRPYLYKREFEPDAEFLPDHKKSFFSGHTSGSAVNSILLAKIFSDYYPESKWKPVVWTIGAAIPAWTAYERYAAGKHFPTDVMVGYAFGALCGYFVPHLHKTKSKTKSDKKVSISLQPFQNGYANGAIFVMRF